jgi:hypothetical protein
MEHQWNQIDRGKPTTRRKTCPSATLSTTNPTWTDPVSNPGLRSGRPASNRLSHGTAKVFLKAIGYKICARFIWLMIHYNGTSDSTKEREFLQRIHHNEISFSSEHVHIY